MEKCIYFMAICKNFRRFGIFYGHLVHFVLVWYISCSFGTFCVHLVHFVFIWYIFSASGIMYQEKSGNNARDRFQRSPSRPKRYVKAT
jgi:hypothetical protein